MNIHYKENELQKIYLYNSLMNESIFKSTKISEFLLDLERFLSDKNYGICIPKNMHDLNNAYIIKNPGYSLSKQLEIVKHYLYNLTTNDNIPNKFEYMLNNLFFFNSKKEITWEIIYNNDIIHNRKCILLLIHRLNDYKKILSFEDYFLITKLIYSKLDNKIYTNKKDFLQDKAFLKRLAISFSLKNENSFNPYSFILSELNRVTDYI